MRQGCFKPVGWSSDNKTHNENVNYNSHDDNADGDKVDDNVDDNTDGDKADDSEGASRVLQTCWVVK